MTSNTDIVLSAPSAFGVRDIVLRTSGAPLYTPAVYVRDVAAQVLTTDTTLRLAAAARSVGDSVTIIDLETSHMLLAPRTASEGVPATVDSTMTQYLFVRVGEELVPLVDTAQRVTNVYRAEQGSFQNTQAATQPSSMYLRTPDEPCATTFDSTNVTSSYQREAQEAVETDVTTLRVADVARDVTANVALTLQSFAVRIFPRSAADAVDAPLDAPLRQSAYYRQAQAVLTQTATALRDAIANYVPGPSTDPGGLVPARGGAMEPGTLATTDARSSFDPAVAGTLGPAAGMMGGSTLALLDAVPTLEDA